MGNRAAFIKYVKERYEDFDKTLVGLTNRKNLSGTETIKALKALSDKEFDDLVVRMEEGKWFLPYFIEHENGGRVPVDLWQELTESIGGEPFSPVVTTDPSSGQRFMTPDEYPVGFWYGRRLIQTVDSKLSTAIDNKTINDLTGQVAGGSKASSFSSTQTTSLLTRNFKANALELAKLRGGDADAGRALERSILETGEASIIPILKTNSKPTVTKVLSTDLRTIHIDNNLTGI